MRNTSNHRFIEFCPRGSRLVAGTMLMLVLALLGGHPVFATEADRPKTHVVTMENMQFSPRVLKVRVGDRIEYKNADLVPHTATAKPSGAFDSGLVKPGESWTFSPTTAGTFGYTCNFHPTMTGELTVVAP